MLPQSLANLGVFFLHNRHHGNRHIVRLEKTRVEGLNVLETLLDAVTSRATGSKEAGIMLVKRSNSSLED